MTTETIAQNSRSRYGSDEKGFFIAVGVLDYLAYGNMKVTLDQAKQTHLAIDIYDIDTDNWNFEVAQQALREARKQKLKEEHLLHFLGEAFEKAQAS